jgi:peptidoglycan/LPS O-acetylase OafA/YrhL
MFIANFLYAWGGASRVRLGKRLRRTLIMFTFWPLALIVFTDGFHGLVAAAPRSLPALLETVLTGGHTIFYFFLSLMITLVLTHLIAKLNQRLQITGLLLSVGLLWILPWLTIRTGFGALGAYWNPLNFLPYPFMGVLFARNIDFIRSRKAILLGVSLVACVLLSIFEWNYFVAPIFFSGQGFAFPEFARVSLLFAVSALAIMATDPRIKSNRLVKFMADNSLALYCLHYFLIGPVRKLVETFALNEMAASFAALMLVILLSYFLGKLMRIYFKEEVLA